jgi:hypothetical protein
MGSNKLVLFIEDNKAKTIDVELNSTIGQIIKHNVPQASHNEDFHEDFEVYVLGQSEELSKDNSCHDQKIKHHDSLVIHRCKKVSVKVEYAGRDFIDTYNVAAEFEAVLKKALHEFSIKGKEASDFQLFLTKDQSQVVNLGYPVGAYVKYPECKITVYLSKPKANQG